MRKPFKKGDEGPDVKEIQLKLKELALYDAPADGVFGPKTEMAVKAFQSDNNLMVDGIVGPQTWNLLFSQFKFTNYARHVGRRGDYDWFQWKVFMDEPDEKLDGVTAVEYRLHETFPDPIRVVEDRASKFALESAGWGEFWIYITVYLKEGTEAVTQHYLDLRKTWNDSTVNRS
jgi:peptidoglycan hydrolase-like protein with peptidoglycan-binding domain